MGDENNDTQSQNDGQQQTDNARLQREAIDAANARAAAAERQLAIATAGIDLTSPVGKLFAKSYDGEATPEAIKAAWTELGVTTPAPDAQETAGGEAGGEAPPADDATQSAQRQDLANNAGGPGDGGRPPARELMEKRAAELKAQGVGNDKILGESFATLVGAAAAGDKSVIVDVWGGNS